MGFTVDFSDFEKGFKKLVENSAPEALAKGMFQAGNALLKDAIYEKPMAPFKEGHLRGAAQVNKAKVSRGEIETEAGFNIVYAARWHELSPAEDARIAMDHSGIWPQISGIQNGKERQAISGNCRRTFATSFRREVMFKEIATLIESLTGFAIGSTLQVGHREQAAPDRCVVLSESAGGATVPELPDYADVLIQAVSRGMTYFDAREDCWTVYHALHGTAGWNMPRIDGSGEDYIAWTVDALAIPQYIGQDENHRYEFSVNFIFRIAEASCGAESSGS